MKNEHDREPTPDETPGMVWWNSLSEADRADWLARAGSAVPADAWAAFSGTFGFKNKNGQPSYSRTDGPSGRVQRFERRKPPSG